RSVECDQLSMINNGDTIAKPVGFVHVMCGDQDRELAAFLDVVEHFPNCDARDRIKTGGGLIQKENSWTVNQAARNFQPPAHSSRERLGLSGAPLGEIHQLQKF